LRNFEEKIVRKIDSMLSQVIHFMKLVFLPRSIYFGINLMITEQAVLRGHELAVAASQSSHHDNGASDREVRRPLLA
jgi:hypothetical protein